MSREDDFRQLQALHRQLLAGVIRTCLSDAAPDLREFAASLPEQVESPEAALRKFWVARQLSEAGVQDFARRFGQTLAQCPAFQRLEQAMTELARLAGSPEFGNRWRAIAAENGLARSDT